MSLALASPCAGVSAPMWGQMSSGGGGDRDNFVHSIGALPLRP